MTSTTAPAGRPALTPDYASESAARAAGWMPITSAIYLTEEQDVAEAIRDSLAGVAPGSRAVAFVVVGTADRICFARRAEELHGEHQTASTAPAPAPPMQPVALDDRGAVAA
jgi:hypothetical protein